MSVVTHTKECVSRAGLQCDCAITDNQPTASGVSEEVRKIEIDFVRGNLPGCKAGDMLMCLALVRAKSDGKARVIPAYYLNAHPLEYQDTCEERGCPKDENHEDGCPTTGWFYDESNFEYDNCYHPISGEVLAWSRLPKGELVEAALSAKPAQGGECVLVPISALKWLNGEGPDDEGKWFGTDESAIRRGVFWWRSEFKRLCANHPQPIPTPDEALREILALVDPVTEWQEDFPGNIDQHPLRYSNLARSIEGVLTQKKFEKSGTLGTALAIADVVEKIALAAMSRVAALSRARPEEDKS